MAGPILNDGTSIPQSAGDNFDPYDHTIPDVQDYVEAHPDQLETVLSQELDGKNRVTLVDWLNSHEED